MNHCKVISFQSTGYNEADLDYAKEKGIAVCSILDYCTQETAESAMALMLNLQRGIRQYDRSVQQDRVWDYQSCRASSASPVRSWHRRPRPHRPGGKPGPRQGPQHRPPYFQ